MRVLYVLGLNRSGSTVFERALGSIGGVFAAGEVHNLFLWPGLSRECGCGERVRDCPTWSAIFRCVEAAYGHEIDEFVLRVAQLQQRTGRTRHLGKILRGAPEARELAGLLHMFYEAIASATGATVITDSSKSPAGALLLRLMQTDFTVVDLRRDPLATVQSNTTIRRWDNVAPASAPPEISGGRLAGTQATVTLAAQVLRKHVVPVSFEAFLDDPATATSALPFDTTELKTIDTLARTHQCEGNPARFGDATLSPYEAHGRGNPNAATRLEAAAIAVLRRLSR